MTGLSVAALLLAICALGGGLLYRRGAPKRAERQRKHAEYQREIDRLQGMVTEGVRLRVVARFAMPDAQARQDMDAVYRIMGNSERGQELLRRAAEEGVALHRSMSTS